MCKGRYVQDMGFRNRSVAIVLRNKKILMEKVNYYGRYFYTVPGGGIEEGETPEEAVLRELKEECGLEGKVVRKLAETYTNGRTEHAFEVEVSDEQEAIVGYDPEEPKDAQPIKDVVWKRLEEISEKDRVFLWQYGLVQLEGMFDEVLSWGDIVSYPKGTQ